MTAPTETGFTRTHGLIVDDSATPFSSPKLTSEVEVRWRTALIDGTEVDALAQRRLQPRATIHGFSLGLQLMGEGDRWTLKWFKYEHRRDEPLTRALHSGEAVVDVAEHEQTQLMSVISGNKKQAE